MAMEVPVQRLQLGDVIRVDLPDGGGMTEATVARGIDRTEDLVRAVLRVGSQEFVREWRVDDLVTVVRGP
jgi:hypothetical protein